MQNGWMLVIVTLATMLYSIWIIRQQAKTIDSLTDKLMAKDYGEYRRNQNVTPAIESKMRKPISYYDDPTIEMEQ